MRWDKIKKVSANCDLGEISLTWVAGEMSKEFGDDPRLLIASISNSKEVIALSAKFGVEGICLPDGVMGNNGAWVLIGRESMIWSPGA